MFSDALNMLRVSGVLRVRATAVALLSARKLTRYEQEAFEAHKRFSESTTYPGPIRAATPGDTRFYDGSVETILHENERHYWRAVTDDPQVQHLVPLRIRFKTHVWVTSGWEQRLQVVQVTVPRESTVQELINAVLIENQSPYLCLSEITLAMEGKELDKTKPLSAYQISENSQIDAVESSDHLQHTDAVRPKDWNVDEITADDLAVSPYKEMGVQPHISLTPRYEGKPHGYKGMNDYSGMKQRSS